MGLLVLHPITSMAAVFCILLKLALHFERGEGVFPSAWKHVLFYLEEMELICDPSTA